MARKARNRSFRSIRKGAKIGKKRGLVLGPVQTKKTTKRGGTRLDTNYLIRDDWGPDLNPALLVEAVCDGQLIANQEAIKRGVRADGQPQAPLKAKGGAGRAARSGRRPNVRGFATGKMADNITRGVIRVSAGSSKRTVKTSGGRAGVRAKAKIFVANVPHVRDEFVNAGDYRALIAAEAERGFEHITVAERRVADDFKDWFAAATEGPVRDWDKSLRLAKDA